MNIGYISGTVDVCRVGRLNISQRVKAWHDFKVIGIVGEQQMKAIQCRQPDIRSGEQRGIISGSSVKEGKLPEIKEGCRKTVSDVDLAGFLGGESLLVTENGWHLEPLSLSSSLGFGSFSLSIQSSNAHPNAVLVSLSDAGFQPRVA